MNSIAKKTYVLDLKDGPLGVVATYITLMKENYEVIIVLPERNKVLRYCLKGTLKEWIPYGVNFDGNVPYLIYQSGTEYIAKNLESKETKTYNEEKKEEPEDGEIITNKTIGRYRISTVEHISGLNLRVELNKDMMTLDDILLHKAICKDKKLWLAAQNPINGNMLIEITEDAFGEVNTVYKEFDDDIRIKKENDVIRYLSKEETKLRIIFLHGGPRTHWYPKYDNGLVRLLRHTKAEIIYFNYYDNKFCSVEYDKKLVVITIRKIEEYIAKNSSGNEKWILYGESFGGYIAYQIWCHNPKQWEGLIMESAFDTISTLQKKANEKTRNTIKKYISNEYGELNIEEGQEGCLYIIHGKRDDRIPISMIESLIDNIKKNSQIRVGVSLFENHGHSCNYYLDQFEREEAILMACDFICQKNEE